MTPPVTAIDRSHASVLARLQAAMEEADIPENVRIGIGIAPYGVHIYVGEGTPNVYRTDSFDNTKDAHRLALALGLPDRPTSTRKSKYCNSSREWSSDFTIASGARFIVTGYRDRGHRCTGNCPVHCHD